MSRFRLPRHTGSRPTGVVPQLWHPEVPGPLWNGSRRVSARQIQAYCQVVAREFRPQKIILFGSYANGTANGDSDVDLLVVMPRGGSGTATSVTIRNRVEAPFPLDLLVWASEDAARDASFARDILARGKVMYEARHA